MSPLLWVVKKDLWTFFADRKGAAMVILVPLLLGVMMGFIFNPSDGPSPIEVGIVDHDGGAAVSRLVERLRAESSLEVIPLSEAAARSRVEGGDLGVALLLPAGAGQHLAPAAMFGGAAEKGSLTMWVDPSRSTEGDIVAGLLTKAMMETVFADVGRPADQKKMFTDLRAQLGTAAAERPGLAAFLDEGLAFADENEARASAGGEGGMGIEPPLAVERVALVAAGPTAGFSGFGHTFAGMLMQFLLFGASGHAKTLFAERASGALDRVRMTRASPADVLLGKAIAGGVVSVLASVVIFGAGALFFEVPFRSGPLAFAVVVLGQAMLVGSFALLLAGLANSDKQLDSIGTLAILFLCFVSGAWVPSFMLPAFLQDMGPLVPTRWLLDGMAGATWRGLGLEHALRSAGVLGLFSVAFCVVGIRRFRWAE